MTGEASTGSEPTPGTYYRAGPGSDDYGNPDPSKVDVHWCTPEGRLTWVLGQDVAFLDALEARLKVATDALRHLANPDRIIFSDDDLSWRLAREALRQLDAEQPASQ